ncbi:LysE family translocator [Paracoccus onubensis]|uniref:LysE family translocator n=1 Tax=Paracoccus onubensis TaxID=1675788 RepID=A0A418SM53_9RHOB|nr:LysE family translocator [Paracoccus onubensis]RJE82019.1 LysE family translocator [Paracoccus onubensis]
MEFSSYLTFALVSAAQSATPGPSTLLLVNNSLTFGWCRALAALSGDLLAIALLAIFSAIGLGALLVAYPAVFLALRLAGAFYIIWLGWGQLRSSSPKKAAAVMNMADGGAGLLVWLRSFGVGISNPKAVLFFAALFPQFVPAGSGPSILALLVSTFVGVKLVVLAGYALGARHIARLLRQPEHAKRGRILTGIILLIFGGLMIWSALTGS